MIAGIKNMHIKLTVLLQLYNMVKKLQGKVPEQQQDDLHQLYELEHQIGQTIQHIRWEMMGMQGLMPGRDAEQTRRTNEKNTRDFPEDPSEFAKRWQQSANSPAASSSTATEKTWHASTAASVANTTRGVAGGVASHSGLLALAALRIRARRAGGRRRG